MSNIRQAYMHELPALVTMARYFYQESPYTNYKFATDKVTKIIRDGIDDPNFLVLVATDIGKPVGMLLAQLAAPPFSHDSAAAELAWYVRPEYRKGSLAMRLTKEFEKWAEESGATAIAYAMLSTSPKQVKEIYTRMGCTPVEISYQKVL